MKRPKAGDRGIPLGDYIKFHAPAPFVRNQLDRGELRYTWIDSNNNARASDDGGPVPEKDWWPRPEFTWINLETSEVRGDARFAPLFPPMFFVRVFPAVAPRVKAKGRRGIKADLVAKILADIDGREELASDLQPADIEKKVLPKVPPELRRRWEKLGPDGKSKPAVSRKVIYGAYQDYLKARSSK